MAAAVLGGVLTLVARRPGRASASGGPPGRTALRGQGGPSGADPARTPGTSTTTGPPAAPSRPGIGLTRCRLVDPSRTTFDYANGKVLQGRVLLTELRYPTRSAAVARAGIPVEGAPPLPRQGGYPTIFFAPGYDVTPDAYGRLLDAWVRAGFVVVAPTFPDTNPTAVATARVGNPEDDMVNQPADVAFVIRTILGASSGAGAACPVARGLVDPGELGLAGQSDGGDTVALLAYGQSGAGAGASLAAPLHLRAVAVLSGAELGGDHYGASPGDPALLVVQSAADRCNPPQASTQLYDGIAQSDKWFLALSGADHLGPYDGDDAAAFRAVVRATVRYFRLELAGATPGPGLLAYANTEPSVARLTTGPNAPALAPLPFLKAACARPSPSEGPRRG